MKPFIDKIKIKNCTKYHDLVNSIKEGTNYSMKETENIKEIMPCHIEKKLFIRFL